LFPYARVLMGITNMKLQRCWATKTHALTVENILHPASSYAESELHRTRGRYSGLGSQLNAKRVYHLTKCLHCRIFL